VSLVLSSPGRGPGPRARAEPALLSIDHVDLYLVHWLENGPTWAWPGMEHAAGLGYARSIGVSNFSQAELAGVTAIASVMPAVDQVNSIPSPTGRACLTPASAETSPWRATAP
jgi:diketogulonate reductase-like aldo/keto reductase